MKSGSRVCWKRLAVAAVSVLMIMGIGAGCEDSFDDESDVKITNNDNHDYTVKLHKMDDDSVVAEMRIDENESADFDDVAEGDYYLTNTRIGVEEITSRSRTFTVEDEEDVEFTINDDGDII
ncbi:MAG: hypothetical protein R6V03_07525 [Kiritimatiellia bacterium]